MKRVRIRKLSFSGHSLYLSLSGASVGAIYGVIIIIAVIMNRSSISFKHVPMIIGTILGTTISGSIIGLICAVISYKLINLILRGDYFIVEGSVPEE